MAERQVVTMLMLHSGSPRDQKAREELAAALPEATVGKPDEDGVFENELEAEDLEDALRRVWDAVAASGTDDHIVFLEHPDLPEHWRPVSGTPDTQGTKTP
jgi:thioesterase domain-containing protein